MSINNTEKNEETSVRRILKRVSIVGLACALAISAGAALGGCGEKKPEETTPEVTTTLEETTQTETTEETTTETEVNMETKETAQETTQETETTQATTETTVQLNEANWEVDPDTGMLIDNSNFIVEDNDGVEHVMTRDQYMKWLKGEYSWD